MGNWNGAYGLSPLKSLLNWDPRCLSKPKKGDKAVSSIKGAQLSSRQNTYFDFLLNFNGHMDSIVGKLYMDR